MQQMSGTLSNLVVYLALVILGAFIGSKLRDKSMPWLGRLQTAALLLLIFTGNEQRQTDCDNHKMLHFIFILLIWVI